MQKGKRKRCPEFTTDHHCRTVAFLQRRSRASVPPNEKGSLASLEPLFSERPAAYFHPGVRRPVTTLTLGMGRSEQLVVIVAIHGRRFAAPVASSGSRRPQVTHPPTKKMGHLRSTLLKQRHPTIFVKKLFCLWWTLYITNLLLASFLRPSLDFGIQVK